MKSQYPIEPKANGADANKPRKTAAATADVTPDSTRGFTSESEYQWFIQVTPNVQVQGAARLFAQLPWNVGLAPSLRKGDPDFAYKLLRRSSIGSSRFGVAFDLKNSQTLFPAYEVATIAPIVVPASTPVAALP